MCVVQGRFIYWLSLALTRVVGNNLVLVVVVVVVVVVVLGHSRSTRPIRATLGSTH